MRALFIYNHNPIVVHPDQNRMRRGLAREDLFIVGIDVVMTESMALLRHRAAGRRAISNTPTSTPPTASTGCSAPRR